MSATKTKAAKKATKTPKAPRATVEDSNSGPITIAPPKGAKHADLREGSKRGQFLAMLKKPGGVTLQAVCNKFDWKPRDAADALRLLAKVNGVGCKRDDGGHWHTLRA
jgi:hypothetical protein